MAERRAYEELNRAMMKNSSISPRRSRSGSPARPSHRRRSRSGSRHRRSFSRSKSRSPGRRYGGGGGGGGGGRKHYSRSRSGSRDRGYGRGGRSRSRSPMSSRRRHQGNRDNPEPNKCLGVFGLSLRTTERDLREVFSRYGPIEECNVVVDAQTGRSRGFAFIYFDSEEDSKAAKEACNGIEIDGRRIRVDFSITRRAHTPTPGIYMGKPTEKRSNRRRGGRDDYRSHRRSPSPQYNRRRSRHSRSRSYSPRRYY